MRRVQCLSRWKTESERSEKNVAKFTPRGETVILLELRPFIISGQLMSNIERLTFYVSRLRRNKATRAGGTGNPWNIPNRSNLRKNSGFLPFRYKVARKRSAVYLSSRVIGGLQFVSASTLPRCPGSITCMISQIPSIPPTYIPNFVLRPNSSNGVGASSAGRWMLK